MQHNKSQTDHDELIKDLVEIATAITNVTILTWRQRNNMRKDLEACSIEELALICHLVRTELKFKTDMKYITFLIENASKEDIIDDIFWTVQTTFNKIF